MAAPDLYVSKGKLWVKFEGQTACISPEELMRLPGFGNMLLYGLEQLRELPSGLVKDQVGFLDSNFGEWKYDPSDTVSVDDGGMTLVTDGGERLKKRVELYVYPEDFGAKGDNVTNDRVAIGKAIQFAAAKGYSCCFRHTYYVNQTGINDPIALPSNARLLFLDDAGIRYDFFGLPVFYAVNQSNIHIIGGKFTFNGTLTTSLPSVTSTFKTAKIQTAYPSGAFPDRDVQAMILLVNCSNVQLIGQRLYSGGTALDKMMNKPFSIAYCQRVWLRDLYIDAAHWGLLTWGTAHLTFEGVVQRVHGQLNTTTYSWEAPAHVIYMPQFAGNDHVICRNVTDLGIEAPGTYNAGSNSVKIFCTNSIIENVHSRRPQGLLDFGGDDSHLQHLRWYGEGVPLASIDLAGVFRTLNQTTNRCVFKDIVLSLPYTDGTGADVMVWMQSDCADSIVELEIRSAGTAFPGVPVCILNNFTNCKVNVYMDAKNFTANPMPVRLDGACVNNSVRLDFMCNSAAVFPRLAEQNKTASLNQLFIKHLVTGREVYSGTGSYALNHISQELTVLLSTSTLTASNLIPKGAIPVAITTIVTAALNTIGGLTGYKVGDGTDDDRWGVSPSVALLAGTGNEDWTDGTIQCFTAAQSVILTAVGGNFASSGKVLIRISYFNSYRDTDNY